jgi:SAM-dependent methyltransferase
MTKRYFPEIFSAPNMTVAKQVIMTTEGPGDDTETRWARETPPLVELLGQELAIGPESLVLDYGCGIGRMAKALIETYGCRVIGVDISAQMRKLAVEYVGSTRFIVAPPTLFEKFVQCGLRVHAAIVIWVLQHSQNPGLDVTLIRRSLDSSARAYVLNAFARCVPTLLPEERKVEWASDPIDVASILRDQFEVLSERKPPGLFHEGDRHNTIWGMTVRPRQS